jgi:hypothetical protein
LSRRFDTPVGDDALKHPDSILKLLDLVPEAVILRVVYRRVAAHFAHRSRWNAQLVPDDRESEHQNEDREDEL